MTELKPCPFCGESDQETLMIEHLRGTERRPAYRVVCDNCGASTGYSDRGDHIEIWNKRVGVPELKAVEGVQFLGVNNSGVLDDDMYEMLISSIEKFNTMKEKSDLPK